VAQAGDGEQLGDPLDQANDHGLGIRQVRHPVPARFLCSLNISVQDLKNVNVGENGVSAVSDQLSKIQQQFSTLKTDAKGQYSTQIDDLSKALSSLSSSVTAAKGNVNTGTLSAVAAASGSVVSAGNNLVTAVSNTC
jgi:hypothetical protein